MNWDMLGHEWAVSLLQEHVATEKPRHAYLITGPQGVGRRTLALRLARALNCPQPPAPGEACLNCRDCREIEKMQHPDLAIVQAEHKGGTLKVDQIRELQHRLALAPYQARHRLALLLRFEEANPSASNALLKSLEEPPSSVILVLTAASSELLLPTIVSRCEVLQLRPLPADVVSQGLQTRWGLPPEQANLLAHISGGRPGFALSLHQDPHALERRAAWLDDHFRLLSASHVERFNYAEGLAKDKETLQIVLQVWTSLWRDLLHQVSGAQTPLANLDQVERIKTLSTHFKLETVHAFMSALTRTLEDLDRNVNTRLALEVLMLDLPKV